jgi:hypothetical protein
MTPPGSRVPRTYLFVPPEEKAEVEALGAHWDAASKRWYIDSAELSAKCSRWLPDAEPDDEFIITSSDAYVAAATTACRRCHSPIQVICIHCESGTSSGDPMSRFTVSDVWAVSDSLAHQLHAWPNYRQALVENPHDLHFANHCPHCGAAQDDMYLHSEPGQPFFDIPNVAPGSIAFTPLEGPIALSGDEHFQVG